MCHKTEDFVFTKNPTFGVDGGGGGGGRISSNLQPPFPSHPGMKYPVWAPPSLRLDRTGVGDRNLSDRDRRSGLISGIEFSDVF